MLHLSKSEEHRGEISLWQRPTLPSFLQSLLCDRSFLGSTCLSPKQLQNLSKVLTSSFNRYVVITVKLENGVCGIGRKYF